MTTTTNQGSDTEPTTSETGSAPSDRARGPLRVELSGSVGRGALDGAWWPYSRDLRAEVVDLADQFPTSFGRIIRLVYSGPDWQTGAGHRVKADKAFVTLSSFPHDDNHRVLLSNDRGGDMIHLLVVPPDTAPDQAHAAMTTAASRDNARSAASLLADPGQQ